MPVLDFDRFSRVNLTRCESEDGFNHKLDSWHHEQWTNAMAGEAGEACNVAKKLLRLRQDIRGNKKNDLSEDELKRRLVKELADVIIYADLAIQRAGYKTSRVVIDVFNDKSDELGCGIKYIEQDSISLDDICESSKEVLRELHPGK